MEQIRNKGTMKRTSLIQMLLVLLLFTVVIGIIVPFTLGISEGDINFITSQGTGKSKEYAVDQRAAIAPLPKIFLSEEDLVFTVNLSNYDLIDVSLICLDNKNNAPVILDKRRWIGSTHLTSYNLKEYACSHFLIQVEYLIENNIHKITKEIKTEKLSKVLEHIMDKQEIDGSFGDAVSTAYAVLAMSEYPSLFNTDLSRALTWLKENRNNQYKCWPKETCTIKETAQVLALLTHANYNESSRIVWDGNRWLLSKLNQNIEDTVWRLNITAAEDVGCVLHYIDAAIDKNATDSSSNSNSSNSSSSSSTDSRIFNNLFDALTTLNHEDSLLDTTIDAENFYLNKYQSVDYFIIPDNRQRITLQCTDNVRFRIKDYKNATLYSTSGKDLSYRIEDKCWGVVDKWNECDTETTLYAMLTSINESLKNGSEEWLQSRLKENKITGEYIGENQLYGYSTVVESSLYIKHFTNDTNVKDWLYFTQNNDGSWGKKHAPQDRVLDTAYALWALQSVENDSEVIRDGRRWLSLNEPEEGWNTVEKNAMVYQVLYNNIRPFLKASPNTIVLDSNDLTVKISNPTFFNIENIAMTLERNIGNYMSIDDIGEMPPFSTKTLRVKRKDISAGRYYGYVLFTAEATANRTQTTTNGTNSTNTTPTTSAGKLLRLPVIVIRYPEIDITVKSDPSYVFGDRGTILFTVQKTIGAFTCNLEWKEDDFISDKKVTIDAEKEIAIGIQFKDIAKRKKIYNGLWDCSHPEKSYSIPFSIEIQQFMTHPLEFEEGEVTITKPGDTKSFIIRNKLDEPVGVDLSLETPEEYFSFSEEQFTLEPFEYRTIEIESQMPKLSRKNIDLKIESDNVIVASAFSGHSTEELPFIVNVNSYANMYKQRLLIIYGSGLVITLGAIGGLSFWFRRQLLEWLQKFMFISRIRGKYMADRMRYLGKYIPLRIIYLLPRSLGEKIPAIKKLYKEGAETDEPGEEDIIMQETQAAAEGTSRDMGGIGGLPPMKEPARMTQTSRVDSHIIDLINIMKSLNKSEKQIVQQLAQEGFSMQEINLAMKELLHIEEEKQKKLKEEKILQVVSTLEGSEEDIKGILKAKGIEEKYIHMALERIEKRTETEAARAGVDVKKFKQKEQEQ